MRRHFGKVALAAGVLAGLGVGVWNAIELRQLREQLAAKPAEVPPQIVSDTPARPLPPVTVAPPDILRIEVKAEGQQTLAPIRGEHLIRPDGTVSLGMYGNVSIAGMTLPMVKRTLTEHLGQYLKGCSVEVEVAEYNSRWFYVISTGSGPDSVSRFPSSGNETVLDAVAMVGGFAGEERKVWVARPGPGEVDQILPVDWKGLVSRGQTRTNYQLLPEDRVFVMKAE
jgi:protein involved in polysaccharide export with SLBB domain